MPPIKFAALLLLATLPAGAESQVRYCMGTFFAIDVPLETSPALVNQTFAICRDLDRLGSTYQADSPLMLLRNGDPAFFQLPTQDRLRLLDYLERSLTMMARSGGSFHPATGKKPFASLSRLRLALSHYQQGESDPQPWDLGGILKGIAVDEMIQLLQAHKLPWALVNGGGDVRWYGKLQTIVIREPAMDEENVPLLLMHSSQGALATSANDRRFSLDDQGRKQGHILKSGESVPSDLHQVSVLAQNLEQADAWATALFNAGPKQAEVWADSEGFSCALLLDKQKILLFGAQSHAFENP